jgi:glycosyltransferase involved in cell wall biosynthesis
VISASGFRYVPPFPGVSPWIGYRGLWTYTAARIDDERVQPFRPVIDAVRAAARREVPRLPFRLRGLEAVGGSIGHVTQATFEAIDRLGVASLIDVRIIAPHEMDEPMLEGAQLGQISGCVGGLDARHGGASHDPRFELQLPSMVDASLRPCVRFVCNEFGDPAYTEGARFFREEDVLWVPSQYAAACARAAWPRNRVIIAPHGLDCDRFSASGPTLLPRDRFRLLYVGTTLSRKGFDLAVSAFLAERPHLGDAELVLKVSPDWFGYDASREYAHQPGIRILTEPMSAEQLAALYRSSHVLLAPARAEAFCLPVLEAMGCGVVPIVTNGCAMDDFCPLDARYSVAADEVRSPEQPVRFLEPDPGALRAAVRAAFADRAAWERKAARAAEIARLFTWDNVTRMLLHEIAAVLDLGAE